MHHNAQSNKKFTSRRLTDEEYLMEINKKMHEELAEYEATEKRGGKEKVVLIAAIFLYTHIFSFVTFSISA